MLYKDSSGNLFVRDLINETDTAVTTPLGSSYSFNKYCLYDKTSYDDYTSVRVRNPNNPEGVLVTFANQNIGNESLIANAYGFYGNYFIYHILTEESFNMVAVDKFTLEVKCNKTYAMSFDSSVKYKSFYNNDGVYVYIYMNNILYFVDFSGMTTIGEITGLTAIDYSSLYPNEALNFNGGIGSFMDRYYNNVSPIVYYTEYTLWPTEIGGNVNVYVCTENDPTYVVGTSIYNIDGSIFVSGNNDISLINDLILDNINNTFKFDAETYKNSYYAIYKTIYDSGNSNFVSSSASINDIHNGSILIQTTNNVKILKLDYFEQSNINDYEICVVSTRLPDWMGGNSPYLQIIDNKLTSLPITEEEYEEADNLADDILGNPEVNGNELSVSGVVNGNELEVNGTVDGTELEL